MNYLKFKTILTPAIEILLEQNKTFKEQTSKELFTFSNTTDEDLLTFEKKLGINIPVFYKAFLKEFNPMNFEIMFHGLYGLVEIDRMLSYLNFEFEGQKLLPIAGDGSGNYFCIEEGNETIFMADHENGFEIIEFTSIEDFFKGLVEEKVSHTNENNLK